ncbi:hypothetical protein BST27_27980 [Mycobacterium intermedium]|uniref:Uncharacterized protein n=1 Tax=Mycobacterium intermedium TaxID=28445 RepID=A0A1E3SHX0_MYCIE|nr:hypothetical protein [Mycobacterium intermedium]MCV6965779.1 hypothetical protein [Mycobacterium intermedium]ODR01243.1 hypothetical protein BHQ20_09945 [Mycobacterium intermedium]OPE50667.1 hypothetical protein BV508_09220 [Mycobacterium intermedium]ORA94364.1 hypothetical protein BST27_27980 [Mycobacterium intermedium]
MTSSWDRARAVADAVLYEGYLLYPYRGTSSKNRSRWQFGVLGPPGAAMAGLGEDDALAAQFLVDGSQAVTIVVRFLQLQRRRAERELPGGDFQPVGELSTPSGSWLTWDEAVECEMSFGPLVVDGPPAALPVVVPAGTETEPVEGGRLVRERREIRGEISVFSESHEDSQQQLRRISMQVRNVGSAAADKDDAIARSMIGCHVIAEVVGGRFVSLLDPPPRAVDAVARCRQHRCFPVLAGPPGTDDMLLISPIILYDHPEVAQQSSTALYDCTEIDEILTLRVMTMTEEEKEQARATDPRAARIIDECDAMSPDAMARLHGVLRDPHALSAGLVPEIPEGVDWWDPLADNAVRPEIDAVLVNGVRVARGSQVRLRPRRNADAQDIFVAGKTARVTSVHEDVEGNKHVAVVLDDDPAADLHDWYGRYLYFSPDEVEPLKTSPTTIE